MNREMDASQVTVRPARHEELILEQPPKAGPIAQRAAIAGLAGGIATAGIWMASGAEYIFHGTIMGMAGTVAAFSAGFALSRIGFVTWLGKNLPGFNAHRALFLSTLQVFLASFGIMLLSRADSDFGILLLPLVLIALLGPWTFWASAGRQLGLKARHFFTYNVLFGVCVAISAVCFGVAGGVLSAFLSSSSDGRLFTAIGLVAGVLALSLMNIWPDIEMLRHLRARRTPR